jgi:hypothetical protein
MDDDCWPLANGMSSQRLATSDWVRPLVVVDGNSKVRQHRSFDAWKANRYDHDERLGIAVQQARKSLTGIS